MNSADDTGAAAPLPMWTPSQDRIAASRLYDYMGWLAGKRGLRFADYAGLWKWSVEDLDGFWGSIWEYFGCEGDGAPAPVLASDRMPGAVWFPNVRINYAEHVFVQATDERPAIIAYDEVGGRRELSWAELRRHTAAFADMLRRRGIGPGDRVAAFMPNRPETVVAFLACASIGAVWSSCAPDMGRTVVLDRLGQIKPKLLIAVDSYSYNGKFHDREALVSQLIDALPSVGAVVHVPGPLAAHRAVGWKHAVAWSEAVSRDAELRFERVPFDHPLWIVYSSGTTGLPKAICHGHGGITLTHFKILALQHDVRAGDRLLFLASTGWIVWNFLVSGLLAGASIVLFDGNPAWPDPQALWRFIDDNDVTLFGCGAAYLGNCMKQGVRPRDFVSLARLRAINSTGSPLAVEGYKWVYDAVKADLWLASISGGTDIAGGIVACSPILPVHAGEIQCAELGVAACAFDAAGRPVVDEVGELVITRPMPSMPVRFWNDPEDRRYHESYFEHFPGIWRHGDWIAFNRRGGCQIYGRSDTTINRHGIRIGTAEIYRVVEDLPEILDSLVVDLEYLGRESFMPLFVVLAPGLTLDATLKARIVQQIRTFGSARHVPNDVFQVDGIPRTLTGKKMELPVRKLLLGAPPEKVANPDAMANPESFAYFVRFAAGLSRSEFLQSESASRRS